MKTPRDYIRLITVNKSNLQHIANTGIINGSLLIGIENIMKEYAKEVACEALKNAAENARTNKVGNSGSWYDAGVDKQSILDENNIPEL